MKKSDNINKPQNIDEFIASFPDHVKDSLQILRNLIHEMAPMATESISYGIPTFKLHGNLLHFSAYKTHIGFYPGASGIANFEKELTAYPTSKGTVQFPLNEPLPLELIRKIVAFRIEENQRNTKDKK
jgi:uncharacterized protein YdhG (YjbR/CyaY superfamily)